MNLKDVDLSGNDNVPEFLKNVNEMINNPGAIEVFKRYTPEGEDQEIAIEITEEIKLQIIEILMGRIDAEGFVEKMRDTSEKLRQ